LKSLVENKVLGNEDEVQAMLNFISRYNLDFTSLSGHPSNNVGQRLEAFSRTGYAYKGLKCRLFKMK
jgi:hypothetical protein